MKRARRGLGMAAALLCAGCGGPPPLAQLQPDIPNGGRAVAVSVSPADADQVVVASETGGLFHSANRGIDWDQVSGAATFWFTDVLHLPGAPNTVLATAGTDWQRPAGGGIWRSTSGGAAWSRVPVAAPAAECAADFGAYALAAEPGGGRVWAGTLCGLAYSDDRGRTWTFLPAATGYAQERVHAVLAPGPGHLRILTDRGVRISDDGGRTWGGTGAGLPDARSTDVHNAIAVSPLNDAHLYYAFSHDVWNEAEMRNDPFSALYLSSDRGETWTMVLDVPRTSRLPFVRAVRSPGGAAGAYTLYFANGSYLLQRATVTHGAVPRVGAWTPLRYAHGDHSDLGFAADGAPVLLTGDGGLERTRDGGLTWSFTGGGRHGYNALQVTEVTGQLHADSSSADLYFATQDNSIWASPDLGATWPGRRDAEGFFLGIPRQPLPAGQTRFTGVSCWPCGNFVGFPVLVRHADWRGPPDDAGNPALVVPGTYLQAVRPAGFPGTVYSITTNNGEDWRPSFAFIEEPRALPLAAAAAAGGPVVFTAARMPGSIPGGYERAGIKRTLGVLGTGTPLTSTVSGFGSLGVFATMFAWYRPYGVDPRHPTRMTVADAVDEVMKTTASGGSAWTRDPVLTGMVTRGGSLRFRNGEFMQVSAYGYDPDCEAHRLIGTQQGGVLQTLDGGRNWSRVPGSQAIPLVSSFFFAGRGRVVISSYGRGLWRLDYTCPRNVRIPRPEFQAAEPVIWYRGGLVPVRDLGNPDVCPVCRFVLVRGGELADYTADAAGRLREVRVTGGRASVFDRSGREVRETRFTVRRGQGPGALDGDPDLQALLQVKENHARGLVLRGDTVTGVIVATGEVPLASLAADPRQDEPAITSDLSGLGAMALTARRPITIHGRGFDPRQPLEVLVDDRPATLRGKVSVAADGTFTAVVIPDVDLGGHTIAVRQKLGQGMYVEALSFHVTVGGDGEERERER